MTSFVACKIGKFSKSGTVQWPRIYKKKTSHILLIGGSIGEWKKIWEHTSETLKPWPRISRLNNYLS